MKSLLLSLLGIAGFVVLVSLGIWLLDSWPMAAACLIGCFVTFLLGYDLGRKTMFTAWQDIVAGRGYKVIPGEWKEVFKLAARYDKINPPGDRPCAKQVMLDLFNESFCPRPDA